MKSWHNLVSQFSSMCHTEDSIIQLKVCRVLSLCKVSRYHDFVKNQFSNFFDGLDIGKVFRIMLKDAEAYLQKIAPMTNTEIVSKHMTHIF